MTLNEIKAQIQSDIIDTKEYEDFLKDQMKPLMLSDIGQNYIAYLKFFNLGFQFAMEKVQELLETVNVD